MVNEMKTLSPEAVTRFSNADSCKELSQDASNRKKVLKIVLFGKARTLGLFENTLLL